MTSENVTRKLKAILSADAKEYSRLMSQDEVGTIRILNAYKEVMANLIEQYRGRVVDAPGDNLLAEFDSVSDAVNCAAEIQSELAEQNAELFHDQRMEFRIGINLGDIVEEAGQLYGDGVNIAARVEGLCDGGGICISGTVYDQVKNKLGFEYEFIGEKKVKNIPDPVRVYRVLSFLGGAAHRVISAPETTRRKWRNLTLTLALILIAAAAAVAGWLIYHRPSPKIEAASLERMAFPLPDKPSIAVLPFENLGGEPEQEYFSDGITDDLITDLSQISGIFVIARNSAFAYKGRPMKIRQVAEELGVQYVLEGSVRKADNRVRINAQLIDAMTGVHLWAERYDRHYADIFELQDEVIGKIVSALTVKLTGGEQAQLARRPTDNLEAYDYYLRAERGIYSEDTSLFIHTLSLYEKAIALDPNFADAHAGYARVAVDAWRLAYTTLSAGPVLRKRAYEAADRALMLDANIPRVYSVLGVLQVVDGQYDEALESARKAVSLGPNSADAYFNLALVLVYSGRSAEALSAMETALRLNPRPSLGVYAYYGVVLFSNRQYGKAIEPLEKARNSSISARVYLAKTYAQMGRLGEAKDEFGILLERFPDLCLSFYRVYFAHYKQEEDRAHSIEALRKAGLPEWRGTH